MTVLAGSGKPYPQVYNDNCKFYEVKITIFRKTPQKVSKTFEKKNKENTLKWGNF